MKGRPRVWKKHGTRARYEQGCRCPECGIANRLAAREAEAQARAKREQWMPETSHGRWVGYSYWGCRCDACKEAGRLKNATTQKRRTKRDQERRKR